jgi:hypothetical protein
LGGGGITVRILDLCTEVSGQLHAKAALPPGKKSPVGNKNKKVDKFIKNK